MPLTEHQRQQLFARLESRGWFWEEDIIYSPNKRFWFSKDKPWVGGDLYDFRDRMLGKMHRVIANKNWYNQDEESWRQIAEDVSQLAETLELMSEDGGLEAFFSKISTSLESFGKTHSLLLSKYYCGNQSWDFTFRHPKGGLGKIEIA